VIVIEDGEGGGDVGWGERNLCILPPLRHRARTRDDHPVWAERRAVRLHVLPGLPAVHPQRPLCSHRAGIQPALDQASPQGQGSLHRVRVDLAYVRAGHALLQQLAPVRGLPDPGVGQVLQTDPGHADGRTRLRKVLQLAQVAVRPAHHCRHRLVHVQEQGRGCRGGRDPVGRHVGLCAPPGLARLRRSHGTRPGATLREI